MGNRVDRTAMEEESGPAGEPGSGSDAGFDPDKGPHRTCLVSRLSGSPETMVRFVLAPDGSVVPDLARKLPGRGVWVTASRATVEEAVRRRLFAKGFRRTVTVADDLGARVERLLLERALAALSMARKAGLVVTGFAKVEGALTGGKVAALIHAGEAQPDGVRKIGQVANRVARGFDPEALDIVSDLPVLKDLSGAQLSLALGGENVIHAALLTGGAGRGFLARLEEWRRFSSSAGRQGGGDA